MDLFKLCMLLVILGTLSITSCNNHGKKLVIKHKESKENKEDGDKEILIEKPTVNGIEESTDSVNINEVKEDIEVGEDAEEDKDTGVSPDSSLSMEGIYYFINSGLLEIEQKIMEEYSVISLVDHNQELFIRDEITQEFVRMPVIDLKDVRVDSKVVNGKKILISYSMISIKFPVVGRGQWASGVRDLKGKLIRGERDVKFTVIYRDLNDISILLDIFKDDKIIRTIKLDSL